MLYRRYRLRKHIVLDFDSDFNVSDGSSVSNDARGKSFTQIVHDMDSLKQVYDSIGNNYYAAPESASIIAWSSYDPVMR